MSPPHMQVVLGSTRDSRFGEPVARWFTGIADQRDDLTVELVDLLDWQLPFLTSAVPPAMSPPQDEITRRWEEKLASADGYVFVTPEYNHGYPAVLKNALDLVVAPWRRKPAAFVSYGGPGGGLRAVEQLRQVVVELEMVPLRHQVSIPRVYAAFDERGALRDPHLARDVARLLDDVAWWAAALSEARAGAVA